MSIKAGVKYHGEVTGGNMMETQKGTLGYQVFLNCHDGETSYTIWLTAKNRDRARETFVQALGVDGNKLSDAAYIENGLAGDITGHPVTFTTEEEEYNGKFRTKVAFLMKRSATADVPASRAAADFFSGKVTSSTPITDEDVPF
jgi:hypothetical protein